MSSLPEGIRLFAWSWLAFLALYGGAVIVCFALNGKAGRRKMAELAGPLRSSASILLSCTFKMLAIVTPPVQQHVPWLWIVPLVFLVAKWPLKLALMYRRRRRRSETAYSRSLRAAVPRTKS